MSGSGEKLFKSVMENCELFVGRKLHFSLGKNRMDGTIQRFVPVNTVSGRRPGLVVSDLQMTVEVTSWMNSLASGLMYRLPDDDNKPKSTPKMEKRHCNGDRVLRLDKLGEGDFEIEDICLDDFEMFKDTLLDDLMMAELRQNEVVDEFTQGMRNFFVQIVKNSPEFMEFVPDDWEKVTAVVA